MQARDVIVMTKGKRSKRARSVSPLPLNMAAISSISVDFSGGAGGGFISDDVSGGSDRLLTPYPSKSGELTDEEEEDMANCLILLAKGQGQRPSQPVAASANTAAEVYHCKTCNRSFPSFQALGGHRASHKKPNKPITLSDEKRLSTEMKLEDSQSNRDDGTILSLRISSRVSDGSPSSKSRVHECSLCGAEFASGQALGGHMRRHRPITPAPSSSRGGQSQEVKRARNLVSLDLNLPAPEDDCLDSKFPFAPKEQVIVFSASSLVDCHY